GSHAKAADDRDNDDEEEEIAVDDSKIPDDEGDSAISLGMIVHAMLSTRARIGRAVAALYRWLVNGESPERVVRFDRREPSLAEDSAPSITPIDEDFDEDEDGDPNDEPAVRAPRKRVPRAPAARKQSGNFALPAISLLTAPRAS